MTGTVLLMSRLAIITNVLSYKSFDGGIRVEY